VRRSYIDNPHFMYVTAGYVYAVATGTDMEQQECVMK